MSYSASDYRQRYQVKLAKAAGYIAVKRSDSTSGHNQEIKPAGLSNAQP